MSGEHFSNGELPHVPVRHLDEELYTQVERNIVYACTDVLLRDATTGNVFLAERQIEPQKGPWLVGGRDMYGSGIAQNATRQVEADLKLHFEPSRFHHIATYSTEFPIAGPGRDDHGRHTVNAVMLADLNPEEVAELNSHIANGEIRDEYKNGGWYSPDEVANTKTDFPYVMKQLIRDLNNYDRSRVATLDEAHIENETYDDIREQQRLEREAEERISHLSLSFGLTHDEAKMLQRAGGSNSAYAVLWTLQASESTEGGPRILMTELANILSDKNLGDAQIFKKLAELGLPKPQVFSDNGPALRSILKTAALTLTYNEQYRGELFTKIKSFEALARAAINGPEKT